MNIKELVNLKPFHTFHLNVYSRYFLEFFSLEELKEGLSFAKSYQVYSLILGGGSNVLFTKNFEGLVLKNCIKGYEVIKEDKNYVWLKVNSGENWHKLVETCVKQRWYGIENLALIPGTVGAAPIQNIGAYGAEIQDVLVSLEALHLETKEIHSFLHSDCDFGYRDSVFKRKYKNQYVIISVTLKLSKKPILNYSYKDVKTFLEHNQWEPSIETLFNAVVAIRKEKLPDPEVIGNAGSFFKNPIISSDCFHKIQKNFPSIPFYPLENNLFKIPAAWLIEQCGWKGYKKEDFGVHSKQALVLVNYGNAKGSEIYNLAKKVMETVKEKFEVELEPEVNIL
jgi:UDP-N-acetylmuramate dehydrogenase